MDSLELKEKDIWLTKIMNLILQFYVESIQLITLLDNK